MYILPQNSYLTLVVVIMSVLNVVFIVLCITDLTVLGFKVHTTLWLPVFIGLWIKHLCMYWAESELYVWFERAEGRNDFIQIIGDSETIPQVDCEILNIIDKGENNYWLRKFVVKVRKKKDPENICSNTLEQFSTLSRFSWIFWKINFNFRLQLCYQALPIRSICSIFKRVIR